MHIAENDKIGIVGSDGNCEDETVERLLYSKNPNKAIKYLTLVARLVFI